MTCDHCVNGLRPMEWTDARPGDPVDVAVCLCEAGQVYRRAENEGHKTVPLWRVWCAAHQVDPSRVFMLEDIYTADELRAVGLLPAVVEAKTREAAILAAASRRR